MYIYTDTYTCNLASCQLSSTLPPHCWGIEQMFFFFFFFSLLVSRDAVEVLHSVWFNPRLISL